jgi:hypothetical protein
MGKILVSKFLLNLLVEILEVLSNSEIYLNSKIKTFLFFSLSAQPAIRPFWPNQPLASLPPLSPRWPTSSTGRLPSLA